MNSSCTIGLIGIPSDFSPNFPRREEHGQHRIFENFSSWSRDRNRYEKCSKGQKETAEILYGLPLISLLPPPSLLFLPRVDSCVGFPFPFPFVRADAGFAARLRVASRMRREKNRPSRGEREREETRRRRSPTHTNSKHNKSTRRTQLAHQHTH